MTRQDATPLDIEIGAALHHLQSDGAIERGKIANLLLTLQIQLQSSLSRAEALAMEGALKDQGIERWQARAEAAEKRVAELEDDKDTAYEERNLLVAALSKMFLAWRTKTAIEGWDPKWHGCVYILLPTGQVSWHYHDSQAHLFSHLPEEGRQWDGHGTPEKYNRLAALGNPIAVAEARAEGLAAALEKLHKEVQGIVSYAGLALNDAVGNTNVAVLKHQLAAARAALGGEGEGNG